MTEMNISTKQKQTHRCIEQICGCQGGVGEGRIGSGISRCKLSYVGWINNKVRYKLLYVGWINNKVLLCSTGKYIQYPMINHTGKDYHKERKPLPPHVKEAL